MNIEQINEKEVGCFKARDGGMEIGRMAYTWAGKDKFIIDHTGVNPAFTEENVAKEMVMVAVSFAREKNFKIIPLCPFVKGLFDKSPEIGDVLSKI